MSSQPFYVSEVAEFHFPLLPEALSDRTPVVPGLPLVASLTHVILRNRHLCDRLLLMGHYVSA